MSTEKKLLNAQNSKEIQKNLFKYQLKIYLYHKLVVLYCSIYSNQLCKLGFMRAYTPSNFARVGCTAFDESMSHVSCVSCTSWSAVSVSQGVSSCGRRPNNIRPKTQDPRPITRTGVLSIVKTAKPQRSVAPMSENRDEILVDFQVSYFLRLPQCGAHAGPERVPFLSPKLQ